MDQANSRTSTLAMSGRILLIEDEAAIADFLVRGLREEGYSIEHAADGKAVAPVGVRHDEARTDDPGKSCDIRRLLEDLRVHRVQQRVGGADAHRHTHIGTRRGWELPDAVGDAADALRQCHRRWF